MKLLIVTPLAIAVSDDDVVSVRAEDPTGSFGIQRHHASLVTALAISVVSWRLAQGAERHCAVRGGVLSVERDTISVATREAVVDPDLGRLEHEVLDRFRRASDEAARARVDEERLRAAAIRNIQRLLRPTRHPPALGGPS
jgi:F-type H+-transporting ATPase subunit epsilon